MKDDFNLIFDRLKSIVQSNAPDAVTFVDQPGDYVSEPAHKRGPHEFFVAIKVKKTYVSFHLMPIYANPALLDNISPALLKRMQGKSCFNFTRIDDDLFTELCDLVKLTAPTA